MLQKKNLVELEGVLVPSISGRFQESINISSGELDKRWLKREVILRSTAGGEGVFQQKEEKRKEKGK